MYTYNKITYGWHQGSGQLEGELITRVEVDLHLGVAAPPPLGEGRLQQRIVDEVGQGGGGGGGGGPGVPGIQLPVAPFPAAFSVVFRDFEEELVQGEVVANRILKQEEKLICKVC